MHAHKIYDLTVVHLFNCIFKLGPRAVNMLQAPRYHNPALTVLCSALLDSMTVAFYFFICISVITA